jgi:hypothetical protein
MRTLSTTALAVILCSPVAVAQSNDYWEMRPMVGISIPTGAHRRDFNSIAFLGAQTSVRLTKEVDLVASFAWQRSTAKYPVPDNRANVLVYNVGLERLFRAPAGGGLVPFAGGGVGGRSYDFRSSALESSGCIAGYGNAGVMWERGRVTTRAEARENLFCYKNPLAPFAHETRNEVGFGFAIGVRL